MVGFLREPGVLGGSPGDTGMDRSLRGQGSVVVLGELGLPGYGWTLRSQCTCRYGHRSVPGIYTGAGRVVGVQGDRRVQEVQGV